MQLYVYNANKSYAFGHLIIAANSREEADILSVSPYQIPVVFHYIMDGVTASGEPRVVHDSLGEL